MDLKNKNITFPDGRKFCFLSSKPVEQIENRSICLFNVLGKEANYSLWLMEEEGDGNVSFWPYEGDDTNDLLIELLESYIETAF